MSLSRGKGCLKIRREYIYLNKSNYNSRDFCLLDILSGI